jgi:hypothetical protein
MNENNKLELKHLSCYLPYGLKSAFIHVKQYGLTKPLISDVFASNIMKFIDGSTDSKIILRPIEDLYNPKTDCGIKIVHYFNFKTSVKLDCRNFPYHVMEQLFKNHFDVFGLIDKGLAISYNDLTEKVIREPN